MYTAFTPLLHWAIAPSASIILVVLNKGLSERIKEGLLSRPKEPKGPPEADPGPAPSNTPINGSIKSYGNFMGREEAPPSEAHGTSSPGHNSPSLNGGCAFLLHGLRFFLQWTTDSNEGTPLLPIAILLY